jgi:hypothetical protein
VDLWTVLRGWPANGKEDVEDLLCAVLFNTSGLLHEIIKERLTVERIEAEYDIGVAATAMPSSQTCGECVHFGKVDATGESCFTPKKTTVMPPKKQPDCRECAEFTGILFDPCQVNDGKEYPACFVPKEAKV